MVSRRGTTRVRSSAAACAGERVSMSENARSTRLPELAQLGLQQSPVLPFTTDVTSGT